jgi:hypothetical protein
MGRVVPAVWQAHQQAMSLLMVEVVQPEHPEMGAVAVGPRGQGALGITVLVKPEQPL